MGTVEFCLVGPRTLRLNSFLDNESREVNEVCQQKENIVYYSGIGAEALD